MRSAWLNPRLQPTSASTQAEARIQATTALILLVATALFAPLFVVAFDAGPAAMLLSSFAIGGYAVAYLLILRGRRRAGSALLLIVVTATVWGAVLQQRPTMAEAPMAPLALLPLVLAAALGYHRWCWLLGGLNVTLFAAIATPLEERGLLSAILAMSSLIVAALLGTAGLVRRAEKDHLRRAEASLAQTNAHQKALMDNLEEMVWTIDREGAVSAINKPAQQTFQAAFGAQIQAGDAWLDRVPESLHDRAKRSLDRALRGEAFTVQRTFEIQGVSRLIDVRYVPLRDSAGTITGVLCSAADRTDAAARERLQQAKETLEGELAGIQEAQQQHLRAWSTATHELQNPLTPLIVRLRMLRDTLGDDITPAQAKNIDILERSAQRLTMLARDILDMARTQNHALKVEPKRMALVPLLEAEVESARPAAAEAQIDLSFRASEPLDVLADPGRFGQVMQNLISNALKFTPAGGTIQVTVGCDGHDARVEVADNGAGISPEGLPVLFQPFSQVHDPSVTDVRGTGLGLYICKSIMEAHGGRIEASSPGKGRGSTFSVFLPLA